MSPEHPVQEAFRKKEDFLEQFPHLHHLDETDRDRFLILHAHNEKQDESDKRKEHELLTILEAEKTPEMKNSKVETKDTTLPKTNTRAKILSNAIDFIPIIGSAKMIQEAWEGKQLGTGIALNNKQRLLHGASGALFLALDCTGIGAIGSELGKAGIKLGLRALEKETTVKLLENSVIREESKILLTRGSVRHDKAEELQAA